MVAGQADPAASRHSRRNHDGEDGAASSRRHDPPGRDDGGVDAVRLVPGDEQRPAVAPCGAPRHLSHETGKPGASRRRRAVMPVVAEVGRHPDEAGDGASRPCEQRREPRVRQDVGAERWARADVLVVAERVVLAGVVDAVVGVEVAGGGYALHVRAEALMGGGELAEQVGPVHVAARAVARDAPGPAARQGEVVRQARMGDGVVARRRGPPLGEPGDVRCREGLGGVEVLHHHDEDVAQARNAGSAGPRGRLARSGSRRGGGIRPVQGGAGAEDRQGGKGGKGGPRQPEQGMTPRPECLRAGQEHRRTGWPEGADGVEPLSGSGTRRAHRARGPARRSGSAAWSSPKR